MGIKGLWPLLEPFSVRKPLYELQGKTVAIDLAGWICESLCVVDYEVQARFYLRNLFFRTCYLLMSGVNPVFVLDGCAPELKHGVISQRNQIQFRGAAPRSQSNPTNDGIEKPKRKLTTKGRTQFNYVLRQCEELIKAMGSRSVQAPGEAEAFCAHLNAVNLVDGIISQDSDCFGYGARRVYRNFTMSMQKTAGAIGGSVDVYDLDTVQSSMDFGRNKIVLMALLCGCDYRPEGVDGVGREGIQKLFALYKENEILERVKLWRTNDSKFTSLELKVDDKTICVCCGHYGKEQKHAKSGCDQCRMTIGCDASRWKQQRLNIKAELQIRKKAMLVDDFPSQEIIDEFLQTPIEIDAMELNWCQPKLIKFTKLMEKHLKWSEIYCFQKFLPLLTRWQLQSYSGQSDRVPMHGNVSPDFIKKKRTPKGIASYEIVWKDDQNCFIGLISDEQMSEYLATQSVPEEQARQTLWTTIEPAHLVEKVYPEVVEAFESSRAKPKGRSKKTDDDGAKPKKQTTKRKKAVECSLNDMSGLQLALDQVEMEIETTKPKKKTIPPKKKKTQKCQSIDKFFMKKGISKEMENVPKPTSKLLNLSDFSFDIETESGDFDCNLSQIIGEIVTREPEQTEIDGRKLRFDQVNWRMKEYSSDEDDKETENCDEIDDEDEFDLLVRGKKKNLKFSAATLSTKSSTPVLVGKFLAKHHPSSGRMCMENSNDDVIQTSFFASPNDEIDLFERSIDLKQMDDDEMLLSSASGEDSDTEEKENPLKNADEHSIEVVNLHDTLDKLLGLDRDYVPLSEKLKSK